MTLHTSSCNERETERIACALAHQLREGDVVALNGPLGAGKTRFVRGLAHGLGLDESQVSSPTYVLSQEYTSATTELRLVHIDAYRLTDEDALGDLGMDESQGTVVAIEWADRVPGLLDEATVTVSIEVTGAGEVSGREISITGDARRLESVRSELQELLSN